MPTKDRKLRPLDGASLNELALTYVGRFATSRAKLTRYLVRKVRERGWADDAPADAAAIAEKLAGYGYVDDAAFAEAQARSYGRRGYGKRRVAAALDHAGIAEPDRVAADEVTDAGRIDAAWRFAQRRRWGPFAQSQEQDAATKQKMIAAFLRAGHDFALARAILAMRPGEGREALD